MKLEDILKVIDTELEFAKEVNPAMALGMTRIRTLMVEAFDPKADSRITHNPIEIWIEGYAVTGASGGAELRAIIDADTLQEACDKLAEVDKGFRDCYDRERMTHWGCRIYDNEHDARATFG